MATHSSTLAWKIPWVEEPGRLQSMGSLGVRHDWATSLSPFTFMHWRRKWQTTPVFLPGESHGQRSWWATVHGLIKSREGLGAGGKGDDRGWDGWMASHIRWTWVWVNSGSWGWTGRPGVLQFMGSQSQTWLSDWIELNWACTNINKAIRSLYLLAQMGSLANTSKICFKKIANFIKIF